jgi:hypothetical protein
MVRIAIIAKKSENLYVQIITQTQTINIAQTFNKLLKNIFNQKLSSTQKILFLK